jgi:hypothetical protein
MIASHVLLVIIVLDLRILSLQECAQQAHTARVEVQHRLSLPPLQVTMLSKDQLCKLNAKLEHIVIQVMQLHANLVIPENIALTLD